MNALAIYGIYDIYSYIRKHTCYKYIYTVSYVYPITRYVYAMYTIQAMREKYMTSLPS